MNLTWSHVPWSSEVYRDNIQQQFCLLPCVTLCRMRFSTDSAFSQSKCFKYGMKNRTICMSMKWAWELQKENCQSGVSELIAFNRHPPSSVSRGHHRHSLHSFPYVWCWESRWYHFLFLVLVVFWIYCSFILKCHSPLQHVMHSSCVTVTMTIAVANNSCGTGRFILRPLKCQCIC